MPPDDRGILFWGYIGIMEKENGNYRGCRDYIITTKEYRLANDPIIANGPPRSRLHTVLRRTKRQSWFRPLVHLSEVCGPLLSSLCPFFQAMMSPNPLNSWNGSGPEAQDVLHSFKMTHAKYQKSSWRFHMKANSAVNSG